MWVNYQLRGSFRESSGCGSSTTLPSAVRFTSGTAWLLRASDEEREGGYGEGRDDADVRAGAFLNPSGSLYSDTFDSSRIDPGTSSVSLSLSMPIVHLSGFFSHPPSISDKDVRLLAWPLRRFL